MNARVRTTMKWVAIGEMLSSGGDPEGLVISVEFISGIVIEKFMLSIGIYWISMVNNILIQSANEDIYFLVYSLSSQVKFPGIKLSHGNLRWKLKKLNYMKFEMLIFKHSHVHMPYWLCATLLGTLMPSKFSFILTHALSVIKNILLMNIV